MRYFSKGIADIRESGPNLQILLREIGTISRLENLPELFHTQLIGEAYQKRSNSIPTMELFYIASSPNHFADIERILKERWIAQDRMKVELHGNEKHIEMTYFHKTLHIHLIVSPGYRCVTDKSVNADKKVYPPSYKCIHIA